MNPLGTSFNPNDTSNRSTTPNMQSGSNFFSPTTYAQGVVNTFASGTPAAFFQPNLPISATNIPNGAPKVNSSAVKPSSLGPLSKLGLVTGGVSTAGQTDSSGSSSQPTQTSNTSFTVGTKTYTDNPDGTQTVTDSSTGNTAGANNNPSAGGTAPYNLNIPPQVPSSALTSNMSYQDVLNRRSQYEQQYSAALNDYADTITRNNQNAFSAEHAGDTTQFGQAGLSLANEQGAITNQNALLKEQNVGTMLGINNQDIQNALAGVPNLQGTQVSPTGDLYAISRDPKTGAVTASVLGNIYGNGKGGSGTGGDGSSGSSMGSVTAADGSTISGSYAQAAMSLPSVVQPYVVGGPQGIAYINADRVPESQKQYAQMAAAQAGIPFLTGTQAQSVQSVDATFQALTGMQSLVNQTLGSGLAGTVEGQTTNRLQEALGVGKGPLLTEFNSYRESAINAVKAIAGGTGGLRINGAELDAAAQNLPTPQDNIEKANAKLTKFAELLKSQLSTVFPGIQQTTASNLPTASSGKTGNPSVGWSFGTIAQ